MRNDDEYKICLMISRYLNLQYPNVLYHWDYAGLNLSKAQAGRMKSLQGKRGWPDLFIAHPRIDKTNHEGIVFAGLFIEVKKEGTNIYKKNGEPTTDHISDQIRCLNILEKRGYCAWFGIGFDHCKKIIDNYLK